ncbi:universal stress protein [Neptuniibacter caesariensis]|uniref:Universal stress protein family protein n=1 Tax=Neptuniibacter caesariensis TaxID=207954 RepID=A0A7U8C141_NEPCE|nr:universal stress protein [Neptuniibacter caesariensis]EAR59582.1 universal stress protein family protein [Oceanospirillum sp. MED92] [Neptuniibacter caesariensis]
MIPGVKKILYASDIDKGSRPAFRAAVSLCGHYDAQITYLHVLENEHQDNMALQSLLKEDGMREMYENSLVDLKTKLEARIDKFFKEEVEELDMLKEEQVSSMIREGKPWKTIVAAADEIDADVIVMGTRPHSGIGHALMGSTATKVMQNSKRPVLIVPLKK